MGIGMALAGGLKGLGLGLMAEAQEQKRRAQEQIDSKTREDEYRRRLEIKNEVDGGGRGRGSGGGAGGGGKRKAITAGFGNRLRELYGEDEDVISRVFAEAERLKGAGNTENAVFDIMRGSAERGDRTVEVDNWGPFNSSKTVPGEGAYTGYFKDGTKPAQGAPASQGLGGALNPPKAAQAPGGDQAQAIAQAKQAIAQGADREAVIKRLRENGINPEGI